MNVPLEAAGIGYDSTSATSGQVTGAAYVSSSAVGAAIARHAVQALGFHYMQALEYSAASGTTTWYGSAGSSPAIQSGLTYAGSF